MSAYPEYDIVEARIEQAQMLKSRVIASCVFVLFLIANYSILMLATGANLVVALWVVVASIMVVVTFLYARNASRDGITRDNVHGYLRGHIFVSALTGIVWGGFAIYMVQLDSVLSLFIAVFLVCGITIGGMLPSSAYRPGYVALAVFALLPFSICILIVTEWPLKLLGLAILVYFLFGLITSARAEKDLHDSIFARKTREHTAKIEAENTIVRRVNEEKSRFLAATSHDLSQPLHAQGYFIQALKELVTDPSQINLLGKIEQTWRRQGDFLRGLIDINRLDSGAITPQTMLVDVEADMIALVDEFLPIAAVNKVALTSHLQSAQTNTDPVLLNRIIRNLLSNAVRYTQAGGMVDLRLAKTATDIQVVVKDNGPGIPPHEQDLIFKEYVQLSEQDHDSEHGVGLGLSIVRRLTDLLGFQLKLQSTVGEGTSFTLTMPRVNLRTDQPTVGNGTGKDAMPPFDNMPLIVVVDDDINIRESMASLLTNWGCQIISASGPDEAVSLLNVTREMPWLFIIDRCLASGQDGRDLIETLRDEVNEEIPAILMSGEPHEPRSDTMPPNVTFLRKPAAPDIIHQHICNATAH